MSIPMATTTITVRAAGTGEPYETPTLGAVIAAGVRAHLSTPTGREQLRGGQQQVLDKVLDFDPTSIDHTATVTDDSTGVTYTVVWVDQREGLGLNHTVAGLTKIGAAV